MGLNFSQIVEPTEIITPGRAPGEIYVRGRGPFKLSNLYEDVIYDAELIQGSVAAPTELTLFSNLNFQAGGAKKSKLYTNMTQPGQLPKDTDAVVFGVHFTTGPKTKFDDHKLVMSNGYAEFETGGTRTERSGPLWFFSSPFALTGSLEIDGSSGAVEKSLVGSGVPSPAAAGKQIPIDLFDQMTFSAPVKFLESFTPSEDLYLYCYLRAYLIRPMR